MECEGSRLPCAAFQHVTQIVGGDLNSDGSFGVGHLLRGLLLHRHFAQHPALVSRELAGSVVGHQNQRFVLGDVRRCTFTMATLSSMR